MDIAPPNSSLARLRLSDLRGMVQLATQATVGVANVSEGVHRSVWRTLGLPGGAAPGRTRGLTGLVYRGVRGVARVAGRGADLVLAGLERLAIPGDDPEPPSPQREAILAALNGVIGDRLLATGSPFATPMTLRYRGEALDWQALPPMPEATGKIVLLIHGLCMNDLQWQSRRGREGVDLAGELAATLGSTPVFLRYNSGLHPARNGRELSVQLERLVAGWPVPIEEIVVVAHSMGGLLIRSACHWAARDGSRWPGVLTRIVFLGTPHLGAPLEQAGSWVDAILRSTPYTAPFAALGMVRSTGIVALRHGSVVEEGPEDAEGPTSPERRPVVPLPENVECFAVAATTAASRGLLADHLVGDGLVPVRSALGQHRDPRRDLGLAETSRWIAVRTTHLQLLSNPEVTRRVVHWLTPRSRRSGAGADDLSP